MIFSKPNTSDKDLGFCSAEEKCHELLWWEWVCFGPRERELIHCASVNRLLASQSQVFCVCLCYREVTRCYNSLMNNYPGKELKTDGSQWQWKRDLNLLLFYETRLSSVIVNWGSDLIWGPGLLKWPQARNQLKVTVVTINAGFK